MGATSIVLESFCPSKNVVGITQFDDIYHMERVLTILFLVYSERASRINMKTLINSSRFNIKERNYEKSYN